MLRSYSKGRLRIDEHLAAPGVRHSTWLKSGFPEQPKPGVAWKDAEDVCVMNGADRLISLAEQVGEIDGVRCIAGVGIECPFDIANGAAVTGAAIVPAMSSQ